MRRAATPRAQPRPWARGVSPARRARALRLYRAGNKLFEDSRYAQALKRYLQAVRHWDHPAIRYNIAVCYVHLTHPLEAYRNVRRALRYGRAPLKAHYREAVTYLRLLRNQLATLTVRCKTPGARVTLDGRFLFTAPGEGTWTVQVGKHAVVARLKGHLTETRSISLASRQRLTVKLAPVPLGKAVQVKRRWPAWIPYAVLGGGAAIAAVGAALTSVAVKSFDRYDSEHLAQCPTGCAVRPADLVALHDRAVRQRNAGIPLIAIGSATVVTGVVLALLNRAQKVQERPGVGQNKARLLLLPSGGPGHASLTALLRF